MRITVWRTSSSWQRPRRCEAGDLRGLRAVRAIQARGDGATDRRLSSAKPRHYWPCPSAAGSAAPPFFFSEWVRAVEDTLRSRRDLVPAYLPLANRRAFNVADQMDCPKPPPQSAGVSSDALGKTTAHPSPRPNAIALPAGGGAFNDGLAHRCLYPLRLPPPTRPRGRLSSRRIICFATLERPGDLFSKRDFGREAHQSRFIKKGSR